MIFTTLNTIVTDLILIIRSSMVASTEVISRRQLEDWVHQYRAVLLKRDLDKKGRRPNPEYIQEIDHLKLSLIDETGDNQLTGLSKGKYLMKTDLELPKTLDLNNKSGLMYVGTADGNEISYITEARSKWQRYKKYTADDTICFQRGSYLYLISKEPIEYLSVRGIFEIPPEVGRFVNPITNQPYYNSDSKYPVPINLVPVIKEMILTKELQIEATAPSDDENDAKHELSSNIEGQ